MTGSGFWQHCERLLVGTGLDVMAAARVAAGEPAAPDSAAAQALRDGWLADDTATADGGVR